MANGQPALAIYQVEADGAYHAHAVLVPTVAPAGIARMVSFVDADLFRSFGLPETYLARELVPAQSPVSPWAD
jgi:RNA polymerase sigma-70 factor (ECF subfamily)